MDQRTHIKSLLPAELETVLQEMGEPKYRAKQIFRWLHLGVTSFEEMSDLSKNVRAKLEERFCLTVPQILRKQVSTKDGTIKYLFGLEDGNSIESVLMKYEHGYSICISTQAGCKMGCVFCASFDPAKSRNLTAAEIIDEIIFAQKDSGVRISNIVLMGTGEPLDNYTNVRQFLRLVTHPDGLNIGMRHISLSTCGLVPMIDELAKDKLQLTLSISLHAPNSELRSQLMPVNRRYDLSLLMAACKRYFKATGRRISFEYAMIGGVNDTALCADQLVRLLKGFPCHVNLIPLNHTEGSPLKPSKRDDLRKFQDKLLRNGINATVRRTLGSDISASCGQLRRQVQNEVKE